MMVMKYVVLAVCLTFRFGRVETQVVYLKVDLSDVPKQTLPRLFLGHTIDASIITKPEWQLVDFHNEKLKQAMALISPVYVRFGGILSDHTFFVEERPTGFRFSERAKRVKKGAKLASDAIEIFGDEIDRLLRFARASGSRLLFCVNSQLRSENRWNSTNTFKLIDYIVSKNFTKIDFSIGNEPRMRSNITGLIVGSAVKALRRKLDNTPLRESKIIAPDVSRLRKFGQKFIGDTINAAGKSLHAASFHQYYLDGRTATWKELIHPETLDSLGSKISKVREVVRSSRKPETPLWITETGSAFGGGARGLSRGFLAALGYADKLGLAASQGVAHVMRQSLFGGLYRLLDVRDGYEPSPEYWISYLFGKLNGKIVKTIRSEPLFKHLRCYAFQTQDKRQVTLMLINVHATANYTLRMVTKNLMRAPRKDFHVSARGDPEVSTELLVNGRALRLPDNSRQGFVLPGGRQRSGEEISVLPALSMVFSVYEVGTRDESPERRQRPRHIDSISEIPNPPSRYQRIDAKNKRGRDSPRRR